MFQKELLIFPVVFSEIDSVKKLVILLFGAIFDKVYANGVQNASDWLSIAPITPPKKPTPPPATVAPDFAVSLQTMSGTVTNIL